MYSAFSFLHVHQGSSEFVKTEVQSPHPPSVYIKGGSEFVKTKVQSPHPPSVYHQGRLRVC